jgi:hypothetical protein
MAAAIESAMQVAVPWPGRATLLGGLLVSFLVERQALTVAWRRT